MKKFYVIIEIIACLSPLLFIKIAGLKPILELYALGAGLAVVVLVIMATINRSR